MGSMLRSDLMTQCDVFLQPETAFGILATLGELGCAQFIDMNANLNLFQKTYIIEICRLSEMERKMRYLQDMMKEEKVPIPKLLDDPPALEHHETPAYETTIDKWERLIKEMSEYLKGLCATYLDVSQMMYVLEQIGPMIGSSNLSHAQGIIDVKKALKQTTKTKKKSYALGGDLPDSGRITVITGLVQRQRSFCFQLMLWRISKGNILYKEAEEDKLFNDHSNKVTEVRKVAFLIVVQGETLENRMKKICEGFHCDLYSLPPTAKERELAMSQVSSRVLDTYEVLCQTKLTRARAMKEIAKNWPAYDWRIRKAKAVYNEMNKFTLDITKKCLIGRCWIPNPDLQQVQHVFDEYSHKMETAVPSFLSKVVTNDTPPTFHRTNRFTHAFQMLINAYGESTYRELNPGLYTIITFPFLFSLMFGDLGHGSIMFLAALWMVLKEKQFIAEKSDSEIWNIFFGGRYIMLLMGLFSMYAGLIYNDCFSKSFTIFSTGWRVPKTLEELSEHESFLLEPADHIYGTYLIGRDPLWELAENKILFDNSLKMKFSIIIGVLHMIFGLVVGLANDIYFKKRYLVVLEFIPQVLFLMCIFLWLVILIFFKWFKYGGSSPPSLKESQTCAPLVLLLFIDMILETVSKPVGPGCDAYMFHPQSVVQKSLVAVAMVAIPIMLFGPPCYEAKLNKKKRNELMRKPPNKEYDPQAYEDWNVQMEEASESFGDLMIQQSVHTIEFVLSTISHTASYLRLWALSLAHAQLSEMLWSMIFHLGLSSRSHFGCFVNFGAFMAWAFFTLSILVLMEGLSAFLHTLRLHWVEFMSKFYHGGGVLFRPFSFNAILYDGHKSKMEVCPAMRNYDI